MTHDTLNDPALEKWLSLRHFEPASANLAERIVAAAHKRPQKAAVTLYGWLQSLFAEFALPRPAYVLASLLCLAFLAGFEGEISIPDESSMASLQTFLYDEGDIL